MPTIDEVLNRRADLSTFVVHLTRKKSKSTAFANLASILTAQEIRAGSMFGLVTDKADKLDEDGKASQMAVCFTEVPLEHIHCLFADIDDRKVKLEPYGVAFAKRVARRKGVNPVWYVDKTTGRTWTIGNALNKLIEKSVKAGTFSSDPISHLTPFVEPMGKWGETTREFWWEREWRHVGDFSFNGSDVALVLAPESKHKDIVKAIKAGEWDSGKMERRVIDPSWSLERIILKLAGLPDTHVTRVSSR